ncbi:protein rep [Sporolactobacillus sp. CQH2019]|uniref:protein rep n=1 Tax=Sporolactobacillus sp. CQH2019 TaxID=3023512 RepID=UPI002368AE0B|nr:protein rep [Sporolactobacillus sp. CQH2019]MDD9150919.1 protein rep [Sporolactobacillus sp. CQH2019]
MESTRLATPESSQILVDRAVNGKKRDWKGKKLRSNFLAEHYQELYSRTGNAYYKQKMDRVQQCANVLSFRQDPENGRLKLFQAYFCKVRLCPMCAWRRSLKIALHNKKIVEEVNRTRDVRWIFLTLTIRNVGGEELEVAISDMMRGFNRLVKYKRVNNVLLGYFRALEVTKNREQQTYHPHFHVLAAVKKSYFAKAYVKQADWVALWRRAMKLGYDPVVDIRRVKPKADVNYEEIEQRVKDSIAEQKAVLEVSKYPVKDTDVLHDDVVSEDNLDSVYYFDSALAAKRLIGYGGLLKEIHRRLNLDDAENGDLIHVNEDKDEVANGAFEVMAYWNIGLKNYVVKM